MPQYVNVIDGLKIAIMVFLFVKLANTGLDKFGMGQFKA